MTDARLAGGRLAQSGKAVAATSIAASTSALVDMTTSSMASPVAGLKTDCVRPLLLVET